MLNINIQQQSDNNADIYQINSTYYSVTSCF